MERDLFFNQFPLERGFRKRHKEYVVDADNSNVPMDFYKTSMVIFDESDPLLSLFETTDILLGGNFDNPQQALYSLRYAQAMSLLRTLNKYENETDDEDFLRPHRNMARLGVYDAIQQEGDVDDISIASRKVEDYFKDGVNAVRILYLGGQLYLATYR